MTAAKKKYLFAVQRASGHEVVSAEIEAAKVSDVEAQRKNDGSVRLLHKGEVVAEGAHIVDEGEELTLYRWPADKKLDKPTAKPVKVVEV